MLFAFSKSACFPFFWSVVFTHVQRTCMPEQCTYARVGNHFGWRALDSVRRFRNTAQYRVHAHVIRHEHRSVRSTPRPQRRSLGAAVPLSLAGFKHQLTCAYSSAYFRVHIARSSTSIFLFYALLIHSGFRGTAQAALLIHPRKSGYNNAFSRRLDLGSPGSPRRDPIWNAFIFCLGVWPH